MEKHQIQIRLMGSDFELIVIGTDRISANLRLQEGIREIQRIENLLTEFSNHSQTSQLNDGAGDHPVVVDAEVFQLVQRCLHLSAITQGAFDITSGVLKSLYNFKERKAKLPEAAALAGAMERVGYRKIQVLPENKLYLTKKGMHIGFGAIGKGYAADKVRSVWKSQGVQAGVINASGDLTAWGCQPDGRPWKIGIADPRDPSRILLWLAATDCSIATSGNYEQYFDINGIRYSHNIDPRTGFPVKDIKSVTIISPSAELSDALATAVTVMGKEVGLHFIEQLPEVHGIIIDNKDRIYKSKNIQTHVYKETHGYNDELLPT
ncbi:FAD:protein FMN transferase [Flavitalea flava]